MLGKLEADPLFLGLTRPPMIFGVSLSYALLNIMLSTMYLTVASNFYVIPVSLVVHGVGYLLCFKEPRFMEIYLMRAQKFNKCPNRLYYGANSYGI